MKNEFSFLLLAFVFLLLSFMAYKNFIESGADNNTGIPTIDENKTEKVETATFSMGCFWGPDAMYGVIEGVIRTRVGYAGGHKTNPTYHDLGNHAETVQIDYNPEKVSYLDLLQVFWKSHTTGIKPLTSQYRSIIFYHDQEQKSLAEETKQQVIAEGRQVYTEIRPYSKFYRAEDYHQKYRLRQESTLFKEYKNMYPNGRDIVDSTSAARVNGYISGHGDENQLLEELPKLGLSKEGQERVLELYRRGD